MVKGGGLIGILFMLIMLLPPPGVAESDGTFIKGQFSKKIRLELKVAQVTQHPLLIRGPLDYLAEGGRKPADENNSAEFYRCKDKPILTEEGVLAGMATELASAPNYQIEELKLKYYCYRFDILSYFIADYQNDALKRALDNGFDEYFVMLENPNPYNMLYLLNQAVFAENKEALNLLADYGGQYLYLALLNFIPNDEDIVDWQGEIKKREHRYKNRKVNSNDLVYAILHNDEYDLATVKEFIPKNSRQEEYLKALNSLIDIRTHSK